MKKFSPIYLFISIFIIALVVLFKIPLAFNYSSTWIILGIALALPGFTLLEATEHLEEQEGKYGWNAGRVIIAFTFLIVFSASPVFLADKYTHNTKLKVEAPQFKKSMEN